MLLLNLDERFYLNQNRANNKNHHQRMQSSEHETVEAMNCEGLRYQILTKL